MTMAIAAPGRAAPGRAARPALDRVQVMKVMKRKDCCRSLEGLATTRGRTGRAAVRRRMRGLPPAARSSAGVGGGRERALYRERSFEPRERSVARRLRTPETESPARDAVSSRGAPSTQRASAIALVSGFSPLNS